MAWHGMPAMPDGVLGTHRQTNMRPSARRGNGQERHHKKTEMEQEGEEEEVQEEVQGDGT